MAIESADDDGEEDDHEVNRCQAPSAEGEAFSPASPQLFSASFFGYVYSRFFFCSGFAQNVEPALECDELVHTRDVDHVTH